MIRNIADGTAINTRKNTSNMNLKNLFMDYFFMRTKLLR